MADAVKNFYKTLVASGTVVGSTSGTTLTVSGGDGANAATPPFNITVWPSGVQPTASNSEIMRVTAVSTDTFTVTRAQESSTALSTITAGYQVIHGITAKTITDLVAMRTVTATVGLTTGDYPVSSYSSADAAIRAAITAIGSATGTILIGAGIFNITASMVINNSGITVMGMGKGITILKATSAFTNGIFNLDAASSTLQDLQITNMQLDCNNQTNVQGITIKGGTYSTGSYAKYITVTNVSLKNLGTVDLGLVTIYSGRGTTDRGPVTDVTVQDCAFDTSVKYLFYINGNDVQRLNIEKNLFTNSQYGCIAYSQQNKSNSAVASGRSIKDVVIRNNRFINNHLSTVALGQQIGLIHDANKTGIRHLVIDGNYFGPSQTTVAHYCMNIHSNLGLSISKNTFDQVKTAMSIGQSNNGPYYQHDASNMVTISDNRFYRCYNIIDYDASIFARWTGNHFIEITYGGMNPYSRHWPSIYESNFFYNTPTDNTGATVQRSAFSVVSNGTTIRNNIIVDDRLLSDPTTAPVLSQVSGGALGARSYYVKYTWQNDTGETLSSTEASIAVSANNLLVITHPYASNYGPPTGAKKVNWYVGTSSGAETKQDYTPTPWQQEYEIVKTTFGALTWTEPTTGLISGIALPSSNTTAIVLINGIYEVSGGVGPGIPNHIEGNKFYGNFTPVSKQATYKRVQKDNYWNPTFDSTSEQLVEAVPYAQGSITGATTFNVGLGEVITATLTGNTTATLSNGHWIGQLLERRLTMGGSGSYTYTRASNEKLAGGAYTPSATVGQTDTIVLRWDGTNWIETSRALNVS